MTITCNWLGKAGRLGNQLWQIAATVGIARQRNEQVLLPWWEYQEFFNVPDVWFLDKGITPSGTSVNEHVRHLPPEAKPYLQDYSLFAHIEDEIRQVFQPSASAQAKLNTFELPETPRLALHVRRGDMATAHLRGEEGYHPLRPMSYYQDAVASFDGYRSAIVFSDDIPWCREAFADSFDSKNLVFFEGGPSRSRECEDRYLIEPALDWIDLLMMAQCQQFILSNSTYSWWAAFISGTPGDQIRYPLPWFGPKLQMIDASLMFPSDWRPISHLQG
jgi:hypothetical protein